jgi:hypothetical protein
MSKINQLIQNWPKGTIKTVSELKESGYSPQVLKIYTCPYSLFKPQLKLALLSAE